MPAAAKNEDQAAESIKDAGCEGQDEESTLETGVKSLPEVKGQKSNGGDTSQTDQIVLPNAETGAGTKEGTGRSQVLGIADGHGGEFRKSQSQE